MTVIQLPTTKFLEDHKLPSQIIGRGFVYVFEFGAGEEDLYGVITGVRVSIRKRYLEVDVSFWIGNNDVHIIEERQVGGKVNNNDNRVIPIRSFVEKKLHLISLASNECYPGYLSIL